MAGILIVDSNLLLVLVVASVHRDHVARFSRTKRYTPEDVDLLTEYVSRFDRLLVTPHILTETSNFAGYLEGRLLHQTRDVLATLIPICIETTEPSASVTADPLFRKFGLTDAAIRRAAVKGSTVLTDDLPLWSVLVHAGIQAVNFNHLRTVGWRA